MKKSIAFLSVAAACVAGICPQVKASEKAEYVYVESNIGKANANSIFAYRRQSDGSLKQIAGSPFLSGGTGVVTTSSNLGPFDSDQEVITNADRTLLFAVNAGSNSIAVFHIESDGTLKAVEGSPFPSGGVDPVSLGIDGRQLFVVNQSEDPGNPTSVQPNYTVMQIEPDGVLTPTSGTSNDTARWYQETIGVAAGSSPSTALVVPGAHLVFGDDFLGGLLQSFQYGWQGLHQLPPTIVSPTAYSDTTTPRFPLGLAVSPVAPLLYAGLVTANKVAVYKYSPQGALTFVTAVPNGGVGICWIRSNRAGTRLYTSDTISNQISVYDTSDPEYPVEIQTFTMAGPGQAYQIGLSPDGKHLYGISQHSSLLHSMAIAPDGTVSEPTAPTLMAVPSGARPQGVAVVDEY